MVSAFGLWSLCGPRLDRHIYEQVAAAFDAETGCWLGCHAAFLSLLSKVPEMYSG